MNLQALKDRFDTALAGMSDEEIIAEFAEMGCHVTVGEPDDSEQVTTEHTFLLTRFAGLEQIDCMATISLRSFFDNSPTGRDEAWENFRKAVTQWVLETSEGRECWDGSAHDLNIGDLLNDDAFRSPKFIGILQENGIEHASAQGLHWGEMRSYDEVLVDDPDEIDETEIDEEEEP